MRKWIASTRGCAAEAGDARATSAAAAASKPRNARKRRPATVVKTLSTKVLVPGRRRHDGEAARMKLLRLALLLSLVAPGAARAAVATIVPQDLPVGSRPGALAAI